MDRAELSSTIIQELGGVFMAAVREVAGTLLTADLAGIEQCLQAVSRQVMGRAVEHVVAVRAADTAAPVCGQCGRGMRCAGRARPRQLQGLVGDYQLRRPYYHCASCHTGIAPLDAPLGLDGSALSPGLSRVLCRAGIEGSFGAAVDHLAETLGVTVAEEAVRRVTEGVGAVAEAEQQAAIARAQRGHGRGPHPRDEAPATRLVVEVDGVQAPLRDGWHELKVSRVAPLGPALRTEPETGRTHLALGPSGYGAGLEPAEACWWRTYSEACQQGLGTSVRTVVVLGDGAEWIWTAAPRFLGGAGAEVVEIVDIYHAYEHLWTVGNAVFGLGTPAAAAWVEPLKDRLYTEGAPAVLAALAALLPPDAAAAEEVRLAIGYFAGHAARMDYPCHVARQFPVGSGAIESTCKMLIEQRAKLAGMRWSQAGLQAVASLRAVHRSGRWAAFWQTQPQCRRPPVRARPPQPAPRRALAAAPTPSPGTAADQDARLAGRPAGRTDDGPPTTTLDPAPTPLHPSAPPRPSPNHPWRRPLHHRRSA